MSGLARDLRHAARSLARTPGFSLAAILVLALGIGANVAIFSVTRAVLLRPLPFREPETLTWIWATRVDRDRAFYSIPNFLDTREAARGFGELAGFTPWSPTLTGGDEPERLTAIRLLCLVNLEAEGMAVIEAADGPSGVEKARDEGPDVILLDVMMPGLDGWRVAEQLLEDERTIGIPIIFLTARAEFRDRARGLDIGGVDYITKPFNPLELAPLVQSLLDRLDRGERDDLRAEKLSELRTLMESE